LVNCNKLWDVNILKVKARVKLIFKKIEWLRFFTIVLIG
jgi:hypothetical protein